MDKPDKLPSWVPDYTSSPNVEEPPDDKKLTGFIAEKPSFKHWNWIESNQSKWIEYLETKCVDENGNLIVDGVLGIGTDNPNNYLRPGQNLAAVNSSDDYSGMSLTNETNHPGLTSILDINKSVGGGAVTDNAVLGAIAGRGHDGTGFKDAAAIVFLVDGTPGEDSMPGEIALRTTPSGSTSAVNRLIIRSNGDVEIGSSLTVSGSVSGRGTIPLGAIIAVLDDYSGVPTPASGVINSDGFQLCDGAPLASGHLLGVGSSLGANTPNLTDGRFLRGSTVSGTVGGADSVTLTTANLASHTHPVPNHTHNSSSTIVNKNLWNTNQVGHRHATNAGRAELLNYDNNGQWQMSTGTGSTKRRITWSATGLSRTTYAGTDSANTYSTYVSAAWNSANATGTAYGQGGGATTTTATGSASPFSILPKYLNVKYMMRVK